MALATTPHPAFLRQARSTQNPPTQAKNLMPIRKKQPLLVCAHQKQPGRAEQPASIYVVAFPSIFRQLSYEATIYLLDRVIAIPSLCLRLHHCQE